MGTKATRKDFYMEIRKSLGRFLSILFIVALGVAFFSGIRASEPSMRITGDRYFDQEELMDIHWLDMLEYTQKQENFSLASYIFIQLLEDGILLRKHFNI